jgi:hypothetical protein
MRDHFVKLAFAIGPFFLLWPHRLWSENLPVEVLSIQENADRLRSGEYRATGTYQIAHSAAPPVRPGTRGGDGARRPAFSRAEFERFRQQRASGTAELSGESAAAAPGPANVITVSYNDTVESVFDFDHDRFLFRRQRERNPAVLANQDRVRKAWYVKTPDSTILVRGGESLDLDVAIYGHDYPIANLGRTFEPIFDPRFFGRGAIDALGVQYKPVFLHAIDPNNLKSIDEGNGIRRLELTESSESDKQPRLVTTWWCDESQGFQPVRYTERRQYANPSSRVQEMYNRLSKPTDESEFSWTQLGDVWVIKTLDIRQTRTETKRLQLAFDWKFVNEPVAAGRFEWQNWNLPDGSRVNDLRMGEDKIIPIARIGTPAEVEVTSLTQPTLVRRLIIIGNAAVVGLLLGVLARRIWKKKQPA